METANNHNASVTKDTGGGSALQSKNFVVVTQTPELLPAPLSPPTRLPLSAV